MDATNRSLYERVNKVPPGAISHKWTLRDDNHRHHHGRLLLRKDPIHLDLHWCVNANSKIKPVGIFRLDLKGLLREGYIRPDPKNSDGSHVRLRILRDDNGDFFIQTNETGSKLLLPTAHE